MKINLCKAVCVLLCVVLLGGCSSAGVQKSVPGLQPAAAVTGPSFFDYMDDGTGGASKGSGTIAYNSSVSKLNSEQEELLKKYFDMYYQSLADLQVKDPSSLFASSAKERALTRKSVWQLMVDVRKAQPLDLSLTKFSYKLTVTERTKTDSGDVSLRITEYSSQNFKAFSGTSSESFRVSHRITLTETSNGWKLRSHSQQDSANTLAIGNSSSSDEDTETYLSSRRSDILSSHKSNISNRKGQKDTYKPNATPSKTWDHDLDRDAAVAYAKEWVGKRNTNKWPTYDRYGGNCQNFASQCLYAGGIPMDISGSSQWKWYGSTPNTTQAATGRSSSWSGVKEFYTYASNNSGSGMVAQTGANYWSGEPGDLIQLGYQNSWKHVVVITKVITDSDGNPVDYLISSNTADLKNYPVSAYMYPQHRLIKVYGWND